MTDSKPSRDRRAAATPAPPPAAADVETVIVACVLVTDDDPAIRTTVAGALRGMGLQIHQAENGTSALVAARTLGRRLALLVTDVHMPGLCGPELAAQLREGDPNLPVLFISGGADAATLPAGPRTRFLAKPFRVAELRDAVRELTGG